MKVCINLSPISIEMTENLKTAIIIGSTGLVGSHLLERLIDDDRYGKIVLLTRREHKLKSSKIDTIITDFSSDQLLKDSIVGDEVFCCLGTTINKAGSKENFKKIDLDLPFKVAECAVANKVAGYYLVSSLGANSKSMNFYRKTKGQLEEALIDLNIERLAIFRPSLLLGDRSEHRLGESVATAVMPLLNPFLLGSIRKYRSIKADTVAAAMIKIANSEHVQAIYESDEIQHLE